MGAVFIVWTFLVVVVLVLAGSVEALKFAGFLLAVLGAWLFVGFLVMKAGGGRRDRYGDFGHPGSSSFGTLDSFDE